MSEEELRQVIPTQWHQYLELFKVERARKLPPRRECDHEIELTPGAELKPGPIYQLDEHGDAFLKQWINDGLASGHLRRSKSPYGSPVFLVPKKGVIPYRVVTDYRALNKVTIKDSYPMPLISTLLDRLQLGRIFTKLDLKGAYQLVRIKEGDEQKAALRTRYGSFESTVLRDGLCNAPATFQNFLQDMFHDLLDEGVVVYIDDITVYSDTIENHQIIVQKVLDRLLENDLVVSPRKCEWSSNEVKFLGYVIGHERIEMDQEKVKAILEWGEPMTVRDTQVFLGFANFYRRFIKGFSHIVGPLTRLTRKDQAWNWTQECQKAFDDLKKTFTTAPVLRHFDRTRPTWIETDGSDCAIGAIASQRFPHPSIKGTTELHPVAYWSRAMTPCELNYTVGEKELLAIVDCLVAWRPYLANSSDVIKVITDHKNLEYFQSKRQLNRRQMRWLEILGDFNIEITYRPGSKNGGADALTRRGDYHPGRGSSKDPNLNKGNWLQLLPTHEQIGSNSMDSEHKGPRHIMTQTHSTQSTQSTQNTQDTQKTQASSETPIVSWTQSGLLLYKNRVVIPEGQARLEVMKARHDSMLVGHPGRDKTITMVKEDYYWPHLDEYIAKYVKGCEICNRHKTHRHQPYGHLVSLPVPTLPWTDISMDMVGPLPKSTEFDAILVIVDRLTKMARFIPCTTGLTANKVADIYIKEIFSKHGVPRTIVSDRGTQFTAEIWKEICQFLGIKNLYSTAYHPQTDGQTERVNQQMEILLGMYVNYNMDNWDQLLPIAEFAYNCSPHSSHGLCPFEACYGYVPHYDIHSHDIRSKSNKLERKWRDMGELHAAVQEQVRMANEISAEYYNRRHKSVPEEFREGEQVLLSTKYLTTERPSRKLEAKYVGPFKIIRRVGKNAFELDLPPSMRVHNVFNVTLLEPFPRDMIPGRQIQPPPPVVINGQEEFHVEAIVDSRIRRGKEEFKVKWLGYTGNAAYDWEPRENVEELAVFGEFLEKRKKDPRRK
ncbi:hypothetical protein TREMEDRAFT_26998 [Tremella mesenterica DSM 1558]|uniref:uncharacterized protein n=1 Tax=Tremella mesenterica (strain ATCC 24925 / CBS 8224 / DSM 1558 / NBRC 9311 / NRRL Y-6157 / RJB 2259-6 / UBC 559-6) TaxID=578456 RepID=UPI0003F48DC1|nr:uncharacterized protein TREMEDRAFT_26998 [Tremella mesenterica DSM 1558]EIW71197.1 hypothetical protein TREMEDRAFT_26998 [Tremella mesenterica DSM 1558]